MKTTDKNKLSLSLGSLLLLLIVLLPLPACTNSASASHVYYVAPGGSDNNPGTRENPWKTISKAAFALGPGDTVYIRQGTYAERMYLRKSGSPDNYITFAAYPGETVVIDGSGIDWGYDWGSLVAINSQSYIKISGLRVVDSRWFGIGDFPDENGSSHIIVENCSTYNTRSSGIVFANASDISIAGNSVSRACTSPSQEAITLCNVNTFTVKDNIVSDCAREGIDAKDGCTYGKIYNNQVQRCAVGDSVGRPGIYLDAFSKHQHDIEVYNNQVSDCSQGICVATEAGGLLENIQIHDNLVYNCDWGLSMGDWDVGYTHDMKGIYFIGNTVYNAADGGIRLQNKEARQVVVQNNVFACDHPIALISVNQEEITLINNQFV